jgi:hypothetical protein
MLKRFAISFFLAGTALLAACSKDPRDPCLQPRDALTRLHFVHTLDTSHVVADTALPNPIMIPIQSKSSYIFLGGKKATGFSIALSEVADSCRWALRPDSATDITDTLSFYYTRELHFISNACGYTYFFQLNRVTTTTHLIDSAIIVKPEVSTDAQTEHLRLYF